MGKATAKTTKATKAAPKTEKTITKLKKSTSVDKKPTTKKQPEAPKKAATKTPQSSKVLDLCLVLDCTASMGSWIERSKDTLKTIIENVKQNNPALTVRASFVGYRDITDRERFDIKDFSEDLDSVKEFISRR